MYSVLSKYEVGKVNLMLDCICVLFSNAYSSYTYNIKRCDVCIALPTNTLNENHDSQIFDKN